MSMKIPLYVDNGRAYVWNADDWYTLRSEYRIVGGLSGSLPSFPRQNDFLGLPVALMSEEAALLVEKGVCALYILPDLSKRPSEDEKKAFKELEDKVLTEQKEHLRKRKIEELAQKIDIIMAGKRKKLKSKGMLDVQLDKKVLLQEEINKLKDVSPLHLLVHLPTEDFMSLEKKQVQVDILKPSVVEENGAMKYKVFRDLWFKSFHITTGSKFGSDYLAYPGDPVKFHASHMVRVVYDQEKDIFSPTQFVVFGRLAVSVNKYAVLAYRNVHGHIAYQTLQWHDNIN